MVVRSELDILKKIETAELRNLERMLNIPCTAKNTKARTKMRETGTTALVMNEMGKEQATFFGHKTRIGTIYQNW